MPIKTGQRGFTLVELMIVIALLAIVATIAVPNFTQFIRNNQVQAKADEVKNFLQYARSQAVTNRRTYEIERLDNGWSVMAQGGAVERDISFNVSQAQPRINLASNILAFSPNGMASTAVPVLITICRENDAANGYVIEVQRSGMIRMSARGLTNGGASLTTCVVGG